MARDLDVVVVDDEEQITDLIKTFISCVSKGIRIQTFNDSIEARDYIKRNTVDVLITDYKMPRLDGLQLMESAHASTRKIMISGYVSEIAEEKLNKLNATFFEKPVPLRSLAKIITEQQDLMK